MMRIAIIAGEASGDLLGAELMRKLDARFEGVGGSAMREAGLQSLFPMEELSVMGIVEVLPRVPQLLRRVREVAEFVVDGDFDALITIDSPDFCHRVARRVKALCPKLPVIHYVAPSVWAWREGRAKKMASHVDHVLCLLPFEPDYMRQAGMSADFVGHPVSRMKRPSAQAINKWKKEHGNVLALFPGSRRSEIKHHAKAYGAMWKQLAGDYPELSLYIPTLDHLREAVKAQFSDLPRVRIFSPAKLGFEDFQAEKLLLMHGAALSVATSGTVSFELAYAGCPVIVCYKTHAFNQWLLKRFVKLEHASLANILLQKEVIPELLFENFTAQNLNRLAMEAFEDADFSIKQHNNFNKMRDLMKADIDAAISVKRFLGKRS